MFDRLKSMLEARNGRTPEPTSLNLTSTVDLPSSPEPETARPGSPNTGLALNLSPEAQKLFREETARRMEKWRANRNMPELIFALAQKQQNAQSLMTWRIGAETVLLLFETPFAAADYDKEMKLSCSLAGLKTQSIPGLAKGFMASGISGFIFNLCPRCRVGNAHPASTLLSAEEFANAFAVMAIQRKLFAEIWIRRHNALNGADYKGRRLILEHVRDHVDCANPYLHWMIAILAGLDGDMEENTKSIARLEQFGPQFVGKLQGTSFNFDEPCSQLSTLPEANVGLRASYGLLKIPPDGGAVQPGKNQDPPT